MPTHPGPAFVPPTRPDGPGAAGIPQPRRVEQPDLLGPPGPPPALAAPTPRAAPSPRSGRTPRLAAAAVLGLVLAGGVGGATGAALGGDGSGTGPVSLPRVAGAAPAPPAGPVADVAAAVLPGVVSVEVRNGRTAGTGSGFVVDDAGHILTNAHVVAAGGRVEVVYADGRRVAATVTGTDAAADVAVLQVSREGAPAPLVLRSSADVRVGEPVLAVGSPLGLTGTVTAGIVSAVDREARFGDDRNRQTAIQTDAAINPGNSGGPLIDSGGRVVGMNTSIAGLGSGNIGIGFAIPIDRAADVAQRIIGRS